MAFIGYVLILYVMFDGAKRLEKRQKEKSRRQTVMMVIHDIEENVKQLKECI